MTVKSSCKDISEPHETSCTHSAMPVRQVCPVSLISVINLLLPNNKQTYGSAQNQSQAKRVCSPELQLFKHLSKQLTFRQDLCYKCSSFQSASVKMQGMTQVILSLARCQLANTLRTSYLLHHHRPSRNDPAHKRQQTSVSGSSNPSVHGNSSRFSCYLVKIIPLCFKSSAGL